MSLLYYYTLQNKYLHETCDAVPYNLLMQDVNFEKWKLDIKYTISTATPL